MIKKSFSLFFLIILCLAWETHCSRSSHDKRYGPDSEVVSSQKESENQPNSLRLGRRAGPARHSQQEAPGLGLGRGRGAPTPGIIELSEEQKKVIEIKTVKASLRPMRYQLRAMGKVLAPQHKKVIVSYAFPARISDIHISIGDWVKEGQKLVTLQSEEVGKARADFFKAKADFELARINMEREKNLYDRGVGARKNLLTTEAEFKVAEVNLDAAEKKLHVLGFSEEQIEEMEKSHQIHPTITLYAPISGKIIASSAIRGAMVDQKTEILTIMDPNVLWVDAEVYERDIAKIKIGQEAEVSVPAHPAETFKGKISFIGDVLKEESRTITIRTEINNRDFKLKPGMFADMIIYLNHQDKVLTLPVEALLDDKDNKIVFVRINDGYRPQVVRVGMKETEFWEILSGLQEGEEVVTAGNYQLKSKMYEEILRKAGVH